MVFDNVRLIKMVEHWDFKDNNLVSDNGILTNTGLTTYWKSVDSAVAFNVKKRDEYLSRRGAQKQIGVGGKHVKSGDASNKSTRKRQTPPTDNDMLKFFKELKARKRRRQQEDQEMVASSPEYQLPPPPP